MSIKKSLAAQVRSQVRLGQPMDEIKADLLRSARSVESVDGETRADLDGDGDVDLRINETAAHGAISVSDDRYDDKVIIHGCDGAAQHISSYTTTAWGDFQADIRTSDRADEYGRQERSTSIHGQAGDHFKTVFSKGSDRTHNEVVESVDGVGELLDDLAEDVVRAQSRYDRIKDDPAYQQYGDTVEQAEGAVKATQSVFASFLDHLKDD